MSGGCFKLFVRVRAVQIWRATRWGFLLVNKILLSPIRENIRCPPKPCLG